MSHYSSYIHILASFSIIYTHHLKKGHLYSKSSFLLRFMKEYEDFYVPLNPNLS